MQRAARRAVETIVPDRHGRAKGPRNLPTKESCRARPVRATVCYVAGFSVVICGGGIAGIEALLRLRRLAGDEFDIALISPTDELVYRPGTVTEPFDRAPARRYPTATIVRDTGARWEQDAMSWIDRGRRIVHTAQGREVFYDAALLAIGARELPPSPHVRVFTGRDGGAAFEAVVDDIAAGRVEHVAFVQKPGATWVLPLYELALLTAHHARTHSRHLEVSVTIPDAQPLAALGPEAGALMAALLADSGIALYSETEALILSPRRLQLTPTGQQLHPDVVITLPSLTGPNVRGIPGYAQDRFLHIDEYCRVRHSGGHIYAAGDATDNPVKHGGIGAQQADTAAAGIAHLASCGSAPEPLRPVIDATLLTPDGPRYLSAHLVGGRGWHTQLDQQPPWGTGEKLVARELAPYLGDLDARESGPN